MRHGELLVVVRVVHAAASPGWVMVKRVHGRGLLAEQEAYSPIASVQTVEAAVPILRQVMAGSGRSRIWIAWPGDLRARRALGLEADVRKS